MSFGVVDLDCIVLCCVEVYRVDVCCAAWCGFCVLSVDRAGGVSFKTRIPNLGVLRKTQHDVEHSA